MNNNISDEGTSKRISDALSNSSTMPKRSSLPSNDDNTNDGDPEQLSDDNINDSDPEQFGDDNINDSDSEQKDDIPEEDAEDPIEDAKSEAKDMAKKEIMKKIPLKAKIIIALILLLLIILLIIILVISSANNEGNKGAVMGGIPQEVLDVSISPLGLDGVEFDVAECFYDKGLMLSSKSGSKVVAITEGNIVYIDSVCPSEYCLGSGSSYIIEHIVNEKSYLSYYSGIIPLSEPLVVGDKVKAGNILGTLSSSLLYFQFAEGPYIPNEFDNNDRYDPLTLFSAKIADKKGYEKCSSSAYISECPFIDQEKCRTQYELYHEKVEQLRDQTETGIERAIVNNALSIWLKVRYCKWDEDHFNWYWSEYAPHCACKCGNEILIGEILEDSSSCSCSSIEKECVINSNSSSWKKIYPYIPDRKNIENWDNLCGNGSSSASVGPDVYDPVRDCSNKWGQWGVHNTSSINFNSSWKGFTCNGVRRYVGLDCSGYVKWVLLSTFNETIEETLQAGPGISGTKKSWKEFDIDLYQYVDEFNGMYSYGELTHKAKNINLNIENHIMIAEQALKIYNSVYDYKNLPNEFDEKINSSLIDDRLLFVISSEVIEKYGIFYNKDQYNKYLREYVNKGIIYIKQRGIYRSLQNNNYTLEEIDSLENGSERGNLLVKIMGNYDGINNFDDLVISASKVFKRQETLINITDPESLPKQQLIDYLIDIGILVRKTFPEKIEFLQEINVETVSGASLGFIEKKYISTMLEKEGYTEQILDQLLTDGLSDIDDNTKKAQKKVERLIEILGNYNKVSKIKYQTSAGLEEIINVAKELITIPTLSRSAISSLDEVMQDLINAAYIRPGDTFFSRQRGHIMLFLGYDDTNDNELLDGNEDAYLIHSSGISSGVNVSHISLESLSAMNYLRTYNYEALTLR